MKQHEVKPNEGSRKKRIRRGRGDASGYGSFSGRGCKGQNARSGGGVRLGFEGGQSTLLQRMPKLKGFKNRSRVDFIPVNLKKLEEQFGEGEVVNLTTLFEKKIIRKTDKPVKILAQGELTKKLTFEGVLFSAPAKEKVEKSGSQISA